MCMTKKRCLRVVAFALIACFMFLVLCDLFETEKTKPFDQRMYTYRQYPEDTIDAVYIGTSGVDRYWIAAKAYEDYGMTVYPLATDAMPVWLFINAIEEAQTYQNPELFIIDARAFGQDNTAANMEVRARRFLDSLQYLSKNWFKSVRKTLDTINSVDETQSRWDASYYLPFIKYHSKWADEDFSIHNNIGSWYSEDAGFFLYPTLSLKAREQKPVEYDPDLREELDPLTEKSLYELLDYAKENDIKLLFVETPKFMTEEDMGKANTLYDILEEEGIDYVSYIDGSEKEMGLDPKTDFYNAGHTNYYGAEKFTKVFAKYLDDNYDLPDRRNDPQVQENWDGAYEHILDTIKAYEKKAAKAQEDYSDCSEAEEAEE